VNVLQRLIDLSKIALDSGEMSEENTNFILNCLFEADATDYLPSLDAEKLYSIVSKFDE
jgi:transcriptional regulatory protein LevR